MFQRKMRMRHKKAQIYYLEKNQINCRPEAQVSSSKSIQMNYLN